MRLAHTRWFWLGFRMGLCPACWWRSLRSGKRATCDLHEWEAEQLERREREARAQFRAMDANFLWPAIASHAGSFEKFIDAATTHMACDSAWFGHECEWIEGQESPWIWWNEHRGNL